MTSPLRLLKPPPSLTVSEWSDAYRKLSVESSSEPGQWTTSRAPYQKGIMDALSDPRIHEIVVMKSAQVGWTEIVNNVVGYYIDQDPCPMLLIQPTLEMAESWSKDRLSPMLRDTTRLRSLVEDAKNKKAGSTIKQKTFPGGHITMAGANSPASLASRPIRVVLFDEIDRYPASAGEEGDPVNLAKKRSTTFWNRKTLMGSTPTVEATSRIAKAFKHSDQRYYYVPCPSCGTSQKLTWKNKEGKPNVTWPKGQAHLATYTCNHCAHRIQSADKIGMLHKGAWIATNPNHGVAGFHINELYSPWVTFGQMAENFLEAKDSIDTLKTWVNTALGETWKEKGDQPDWKIIKDRAEPYQMMTVPDKAYLLVCGVDTHKDRLPVVVTAYGRNKESWRIFYTELRGDPFQQDVWNQLTNLLNYNYKHASGVDLRIVSTAIDSGGSRTQAVYDYVRNAPPNVIAIKGMSTPGKPVIGKPSKQDVNYDGTYTSSGVELWPIGSDTIKAQIYGFLKNTEQGPGFFHTPMGLPDQYYRELTAEKLITKKKAGIPYQVWDAGSRDNHALDCEGYAYAAAVRVGLDVLDFDQLEIQISNKAREGLTASNPNTPNKKRRRKGTISEVK